MVQSVYVYKYKSIRYLLLCYEKYWVRSILNILKINTKYKRRINKKGILKLKNNAVIKNVIVDDKEITTKPNINNRIHRWTFYNLSNVHKLNKFRACLE